jgi:hypothetical protein
VVDSVDEPLVSLSAVVVQTGRDLSEIIAALPRAAVLGPSTACEFARPGGQSVLYDYESTAEPDTATVVVTPCAGAFTIFDAETMVLTKSEVLATLSGGGRQAVSVFRNIEGRVDLTGVPRRRRGAHDHLLDCRRGRPRRRRATARGDRSDLGGPRLGRRASPGAGRCRGRHEGGLRAGGPARDRTAGRAVAATSGTAVQIHDDFWPR